MRVISQDGYTDIPYEDFVFSATDDWKIKVAKDVVHNTGEGKLRVIAEYSSREKVLKVMELLRETYIGMPIVMQNVDVSEDLAKEFERLNKCGVMVLAENQPSKVDFISSAVFQFPQDNEIEV